MNEFADDVRARLASAEQQAVLLALDGFSVRQIAERLNLGEPHIRVLLTRSKPCDNIGCGVPQDGAGRPLRGWVQIKHGKTRPWFCSYPCAGRWLAKHLTDAA